MIPGGAALREEDSSFVEEDEEEEEEEIEEGIAQEERTVAMADPANLHVHPDAHHDEAMKHVVPVATVYQVQGTIEVDSVEVESSDNSIVLQQTMAIMD